MIVYLINDDNIHSKHTENYAIESIGDKKNQILFCVFITDNVLCVKCKFPVLNICVNLIW